MEEIKHRVFVCGDVHGSYDIKKLSTKNWKVQKELTKDDFLIFLGDFGNPWSCGVKDGVETITSWQDIIMSKDDKYWLDWVVAKKFTSLIVLGNHEGIYGIWNKLNIVYYEPIKGYVKELPLEHGVIRFLLRDSEYYINDKRFLVVGGALSIDKEYRIPDVSWWELELLTKEEQDNVLDTLAKNNEFDYVLSHTCPSIVIPFFTYEYNPKLNDPVSKFLGYVENMIEFKEWHFGHFHLDETYTDNLDNHFQCHYNSEPYELSV